GSQSASKFNLLKKIFENKTYWKLVGFCAELHQISHSPVLVNQPPYVPLTSLAVFQSVAQGKVSVPQEVTPSYTQAYHAALLRDPSITYLVLRSRDVPPAVSPAM
ncbi:unnamed protein product, partial [Staurois parvus]